MDKLNENNLDVWSERKQNIDIQKVRPLYVQKKIHFSFWTTFEERLF